MGRGVVADLESGRSDQACGVWGGVDGIAHLEERGGSLLLLEGLQELTGALAGAVVIGECHALPSDAVDAHCG